MGRRTKKQWGVYLAFLLLCSFSAFSGHIFFSPDELFVGGSRSNLPQSEAPGLKSGLMQAGYGFVLFLPLGLAGFWFARKLSIPAIFRPGGDRHSLLVQPLIIGIGLGIILVVIDILFSALGAEKIPHPPFPLSIIASVTAAISEEILFRFFFMGLIAFLISRFLRGKNSRVIALWSGNAFAAVLFGAAHLPGAMMIYGAAHPLEIPPVTLIHIFLICVLVGLGAGERYMRDGLIAAIGVHFWVDIVWHVLWPLI